MTYTKDIARHDRITVDGVDVSNAFRSFDLTDEDTDEDVTGFSESGNQETLPGTANQQFQGEAFYTPELYALLKPLKDNRTEFEVTWQPDGLVDDTREVYVGTCTLRTFNPTATVGTVRVMTCTFKPASSEGINSTPAT